MRLLVSCPRERHTNALDRDDGGGQVREGGEHDAGRVPALDRQLARAIGDGDGIARVEGLAHGRPLRAFGQETDVVSSQAGLSVSTAMVAIWRQLSVSGSNTATLGAGMGCSGAAGSSVVARLGGNLLIVGVLR